MPRLMKKMRHSHSMDDITHRLEARLGKIPLSGRYHKLPRKLEDDYVLSEDILGSGYSGQVLMATARHNAGQRVAVKSLALNDLDPVHKEHMACEVENYLCMDHPHITRLYDVYESKTHLHFVMECMEGGELFDRISKRKRFSEEDAADALRQMLLALNYIHSHGIVHRDVKLENFMCDEKGSGHLKLIDFGFSKMWDQTSGEKMKQSLGTLAYAAPEVLNRSYTSQCDLWSLGVIAFILLAGYMPFQGTEANQMKDILLGKYNFKQDRWNGVSDNARDFVFSLLDKDPNTRLTAKDALLHPFIAQRQQQPSVNTQVVEALRQFGYASPFRRCCLEMVSWSLTNEERAKVREYFIALDTDKQGTVSKQELKEALTDKLQVSDEKEVEQIFKALDYNHDQEVHYSDFLAAMVSTQIELHAGLLSETFRRFDTDGSGYITVSNLRQVLGDRVEGSKVEAFIREADQNHDSKLSYEEFAEYLRNPDILAAQTLNNLPKRRSSLSSALGGLRAKVFQRGCDLEKAHKMPTVVSL